MSKVSASPGMSRSPSPASRVKKRKRSDPSVEELEVDVNAPEPPSKKALRKAKKAKTSPAITISKDRLITVIPDAKDAAEKPSKKAVRKTQKGTNNLINVAAESGPIAAASDSDNVTTEQTQPPKRSEHGIWIGNLPWSATKHGLRKFLTTDTRIPNEVITRIHMPAPSEAAAADSRGAATRKNKGFAYVDFSTKQALTAATELSETLLTGRRVLIKESKSFEGRPDKPKEDTEPIAFLGKPPSKRVFVGNLGFDTSKEDIQDHFSRCGDILDVHLATFEDSGKCKGYGWVEFDNIEAAQAAVQGWVNIEQKQDDSDDEDQGHRSERATQARPKKKLRPRKWWVNKLHGRLLRMEFAEDKAVRYKKRFGRNAPTQKDAPLEAETENPVTDPVATFAPAATAPSRAGKAHAVERAHQKRFGARTIKPGAAHAGVPRLQGGIVASQGKKTILA